MRARVVGSLTVGSRESYTADPLIDPDQANSEQQERDRRGEGGKPGRGQDGDGGRHAEGGQPPGGSIGPAADPGRQHHHRCARSRLGYGQRRIGQSGIVQPRRDVETDDAESENGVGQIVRRSSPRLPCRGWPCREMEMRPVRT